MRIVCTVTNDLSHDQRMDRICTSLAKAGHTVTLVGRILPNSPPPSPDRPYRQHRLTCRYHTGKAFYAEFNYRLTRELASWNFDALCSVDLDTLLAGWWLTRGRADRRWVYDAHEWFSETPEVVARPLVRGAWRRLGRWLVPKTDARYTVGPMLAGELERDYGVAFGVVRNAPVLRSPLPPQPSAPATAPRFKGRNILLYQGMLNPGRGLNHMIAALAELPDCALWLVGSGPEEGMLRRLANDYRVDERVWFAGFRPPAELPALTVQADLGLNLLEATAPSYYYSLANKSLDYVHAGLPSLQMDFPEYRAIGEPFNCYELVEMLSTEAIVRATERALLPARYAELEVGCRRAARELNWQNEEKRLLRFFEFA